MDLARIKQFIKQNGDKFILIENGEPEVVVMSFKEYEALARRSSPAREPPQPMRAHLEEEGDGMEPPMPEAEFVAPSPSHSMDLGGSAAVLPVRLEDIRLEDLPI